MENFLFKYIVKDNLWLLCIGKIVYIVCLFLFLDLSEDVWDGGVGNVI